MVLLVIKQRSIPTPVATADDISEGRKISKGLALANVCLKETTVVGNICKLVAVKTKRRHAPS